MLAKVKYSKEFFKSIESFKKFLKDILKIKVYHDRYNNDIIIFKRFYIDIIDIFNLIKNEEDFIFYSYIRQGKYYKGNKHLKFTKNLLYLYPLSKDFTKELLNHNLTVINDLKGIRKLQKIILDFCKKYIFIQNSQIKIKYYNK